jgi:hypothetical protein
MERGYVNLKKDKNKYAFMLKTTDELNNEMKECIRQTKLIYHGQAVVSEDKIELFINLLKGNHKKLQELIQL